MVSFLDDTTSISLTSSNNQFSEFWILNIYNEILFICLINSRARHSGIYILKSYNLFWIFLNLREASKWVLRIVQKFSCKYSRFGIGKIGCSMTWARYRNNRDCIQLVQIWVFVCLNKQVCRHFLFLMIPIQIFRRYRILKTIWWTKIKHIAKITQICWKLEEVVHKLVESIQGIWI